MSFTEEFLKDAKKKADPPFPNHLPMNADLSWKNIYGFSLLSGLKKYRNVKTIGTSGTGRYDWVEDTQTRRAFILCRKDGTLVQLTKDDLSKKSAWNWKKC